MFFIKIYSDIPVKSLFQDGFGLIHTIQLCLILLLLFRYVYCSLIFFFCDYCWKTENIKNSYGFPWERINLSTLNMVPVQCLSLYTFLKRWRFVIPCCLLSFISFKNISFFTTSYVYHCDNCSFHHLMKCVQ